MKEQKDKFYILQEPKKSILTILVVGSKFPLSPETHESLERLKENSDILFIFDSAVYSGIHGISKEKFSTLYGSSCWVDSEEGFMRSIINTLRYEREVFKYHSSILIANLDGLGNISEKELLNITKLNASDISCPVLKISRLGTDSFYDIYKEPEKKLFTKRTKENNMYSSYIETTRFTFLRPHISGVILDFLETSDIRNYLETFTYKNFKYFFASVIKYLGLEYINNSVEDVKI